MAPQNPEKGFTLFGLPLFGRAVFAVKPPLPWQAAAKSLATWVSAVSVVLDRPTLFARPLFGKSLFSDIPIVAWEHPGPNRADWANADETN